MYLSNWSELGLSDNEAMCVYTNPRNDPTDTALITDTPVHKVPGRTGDFDSCSFFGNDSGSFDDVEDTKSITTDPPPWKIVGIGSCTSLPDEDGYVVATVTKSGESVAAAVIIEAGAKRGAPTFDSEVFQ